MWVMDGKNDVILYVLFACLFFEIGFLGWNFVDQASLQPVDPPASAY